MFYEQYEIDLWRAQLKKETPNGACYSIFAQLETKAREALADVLQLVDSAGDNDFLRRVLYMRCIKGFSYAQIGIETGIAEDTIRAQIKRHKKRLLQRQQGGPS